MAHPNETVIVPTGFLDAGITPETKKFVIHAATPNDLRLSLDTRQKRLLSNFNSSDFDKYVWPKPNTTVNGIIYTENTDIAFYRLTSPNFPIIVEKIKVCLHQSTTYGCIKLNIWNFGNNESERPLNMVDIDSSQGDDSDYTSPLTIGEGCSLISNALEEEDQYMKATSQKTLLPTFDENLTIQPNSILRFGIQYAEGNAYGLKVFIIGWATECD